MLGRGGLTAFAIVFRKVSLVKELRLEVEESDDVFVDAILHRPLFPFLPSAFVVDVNATVGNWGRQIVNHGSIRHAVRGEDNMPSGLQDVLADATAKQELRECRHHHTGCRGEFVKEQDALLTLRPEAGTREACQLSSFRINEIREAGNVASFLRQAVNDMHMSVLLREGGDEGGLADSRRAPQKWP